MVSIRTVAPIIALLALLPVAAFVVQREAVAVVASLVCVVLIALSLYLMLSPADVDELSEGLPGAK